MELRSAELTFAAVRTCAFLQASYLAHAYAPVEELLRPLQDGLFTYVGMETLPPFVAFAASRSSDEERRGYLDAYERHLAAITASGEAGPWQSAARRAPLCP
ncbi:NAD(P)H-dependent oxidoreductase [Micromonospora sp. STR1s_5]|nr:NAD(P)H-dependent oxidoreductase [Micromonospora sp. STR1s_5]